MTIPASGAVSFSDLRSEFVPGNSGSVSLGNFYRGLQTNEALVLSGPTQNANIATSGTITMASFRGAVQGLNLTGQVRLLSPVANCGGVGVRAGSVGVSTPNSIYNYVYWNPAGYVTPSNGRQTQAGTLVSGVKYGYIVLTSGDQSGGSRQRYDGPTIPSRGYNSGQGEAVMGTTQFQDIKANSGFPTLTAFGHQGTVTVNFTTITASQGSGYGQLIVRHQTGTSDPSKGGAYAYFWPYNILKKGYELMGMTFNEGG